MSYLTLEVEIDHGRIIPRQPEKLPDRAKGLLTIIPTPDNHSTKQRVQLPLIQGDGKRLVNPTSEDLDASLWGD
jgi:hypothetical protein